MDEIFLSHKTPPQNQSTQLPANPEMLEVPFAIEKLLETHLELLKTSQGGTGHLTCAGLGHTKTTNPSLLIGVLLKVGNAMLKSFLWT